MNDYKALIEKLSRELDAMAIVIDSAYRLDSPEVQEVPMLSLHLNIGETRLIYDVLRCCHRLDSEPHCQ